MIRPPFRPLSTHGPKPRHCLLGLSTRFSSRRIDIMYETLAILAAAILVYSSVAGAVERTWISGPIVFTCFGLLLGPVGLDLLPWEANRETILNLAEVTLALVLFTDAASADMGVLKRIARLPARLLLIGLPLTILLGFGTGLLLFDGWVCSSSPFSPRC